MKEIIHLAPLAPLALAPLALKQYQKSLEIKETIGDIPSLAISLYQIGNLNFQKKEFAIALEFYIQAFLIFTKIGSPNAKTAKDAIDRCRENLPEEQFHAILKKFEIRISKSETNSNDQNTNDQK